VPAGTGKDGVGTAASFSDPFSISVSTDSSFALFAEFNVRKIKKIDLATATVTTIAGGCAYAVCGGAPGYGHADGVGSAVGFQSLGGVTLSRDGSFALIATGATGRIRKLVVATGKVTTLAGNSVVDQWPATNGIGAAASFNRPKGLALSADGSWAVVSESGGHRIRKVVVSTGLVTTLAGNPPGCSGHTTCRGHANGVGSAATFDNPNRIALSSDDSFALVTDGTNGGLIRKIVIATGAVTTLAGNGVGAADGVGSAAGFRSLEGVALSPDGSMALVMDRGNKKIRKVVVATGAVTTFAGSGAAGKSNGVGKAATFDWLQGVTMSSDGTWMLTTEGGANNLIRKITTGMQCTTTLSAGTASQVTSPGTGQCAAKGTAGITTALAPSLTRIPHYGKAGGKCL
jgi:hypothetical protein